MPHRTITALEGFVRPHVAVGKSRVETLCLLLVGMVHARTVNLGHVACARGGSVQRASTCRRLQRFFQHVRLGEDWALPLLVGLIGPARRWTLALDRTNWSIGSREVNHLVLAVVTRRFRVPLLWTVLPGKGASSMAARIALLKRYLAHFPAATIRVLLADREFVGAEWLEFLDDNNIPFAIRLRENMRVVTEDGSELTLLARLTGRQRTRSFRGRLWSAREDGALLDFAAKRLPEGWLVVVSNLPPRRAARRLPPPLGDRMRSARSLGPMALGASLGDARTRGLNIEDTRLTCPRKLALLMAIVALAWAGRAAAELLGNRPPERKSHGCLARSFFRIGIDHIRTTLGSHPEALLPSRRNLAPRTTEMQRVV